MSADRTAVPAESPLLTFAEAMAFLRMSRATLRRRVEDRQIRCIKDSARVKFHRDDLVKDTWAGFVLDGRRRGLPDPPTNAHPWEHIGRRPNLVSR